MMSSTSIEINKYTNEQLGKLILASTLELHAYTSKWSENEALPLEKMILRVVAMKEEAIEFTNMARRYAVLVEERERRLKQLLMPHTSHIEVISVTEKENEVERLYREFRQEKENKQKEEKRIAEERERKKKEEQGKREENERVERENKRIERIAEERIKKEEQEKREENERVEREKKMNERIAEERKMKEEQEKKEENERVEREKKEVIVEKSPAVERRKESPAEKMYQRAERVSSVRKMEIQHEIEGPLVEDCPVFGAPEDVAACDQDFAQRIYEQELSILRNADLLWLEDDKKAWNNIEYIKWCNALVEKEKEEVKEEEKEKEKEEKKEEDEKEKEEKEKKEKEEEEKKEKEEHEDEFVYDDFEEDTVDLTESETEDNEGDSDINPLSISNENMIASVSSICVSHSIKEIEKALAANRWDVNEAIVKLLAKA